VAVPEKAISSTGIIPNNRLVLRGLLTNCPEWSIIFFEASRAIETPNRRLDQVKNHSF